jgi:hypothetical protein
MSILLLMGDFGRFQHAVNLDELHQHVKPLGMAGSLYGFEFLYFLFAQHNANIRKRKCWGLVLCLGIKENRART